MNSLRLFPGMVFFTMSTIGASGNNRTGSKSFTTIVFECINGGIRDMCVPGAEDERVSIRSRAGDPAGSDGAVRASDVFDDNGLTKRCAHPLCEGARDVVGQSTRRERHDYRNSP